MTFGIVDFVSYIYVAVLMLIAAETWSAPLTEVSWFELYVLPVFWPVIFPLWIIRAVVRRYLL